jgi:hypothetical protein
MKRAFVGLSVAAAVAFATSAAQALTVDVLDTTQAWANVNPAQSLNLGGGVWAPSPSQRAGNDPGDFRSPWDPSGDNVPAMVGWETVEYWATGPTNPTEPAVLVFASDQTDFRLLWGSVDTYNKLEFLAADGLTVVATVTSASLLADDPSVEIGEGSAYVRIFDLVFRQVRFSSNGINAFEFSNVSVPIPPALLLFGSAIAGLYLARRRRQTTGPVAA